VLDVCVVDEGVVGEIGAGAGSSIVVTSFAVSIG
jgi:hypothetical protein